MQQSEEIIQTVSCFWKENSLRRHCIAIAGIFIVINIFASAIDNDALGLLSYLTPVVYLYFANWFIKDNSEEERALAHSLQQRVKIKKSVATRKRQLAVEKYRETNREERSELLKAKQGRTKTQLRQKALSVEKKRRINSEEKSELLRAKRNNAKT